MRLAGRLLRPLLLASIVSLVALASPPATFARATPSAVTFNWVPNWPVNYGKGVPDWGGADVTGVAVDASKNVHVCLGTEHPVVVFNQKGEFLRSWGEGVLLDPHTVRIDPHGNFWTTDITTHQVCEFSPDGTLLKRLGVGGPNSDLSHFAGPADVAFAPNGDIYIADGHWNNRVFHMDANANVINVWGSYGTQPGQFRLPHSVAVDAQSRVWVADRMNRRLQLFTANGQFISQLKMADYPHSLYITPDQKLYVGGLSGLWVYTLDGQLLGHFSQKGRGRGRIYEAHMITVDSDGELYEADAAAKRAQKFLIH